MVPRWLNRSFEAFWTFSISCLKIVTHTLGFEIFNLLNLCHTHQSLFAAISYLRGTARLQPRQCRPSRFRLVSDGIKNPWRDEELFLTND